MSSCLQLTADTTLTRADVYREPARWRDQRQEGQLVGLVAVEFSPGLLDPRPGIGIPAVRQTRFNLLPLGSHHCSLG